jgi:hypothetical protein
MRRPVFALRLTRFLLLCVFMFLSACAAPSPVPPESAATIVPTSVPTEVSSAPTIAPTSQPTAVATTNPIPTAVATTEVLAGEQLPTQPHPSWIAIRQVGDPVEGFSSISLVDADTGQRLDNVCRATDGSPLAWSYDGSWLGCSFHFGNNAITLVNAVDPTVTMGWSIDSLPEAATFFAWAPLEQTLAVSVGSDVYLIVPDQATEPRLLKTCEGYNCSAIAWSPDGQRLATNNIDGLSVLDLASGNEVLIADEGIYLSGSTPDTRDIRTPLLSVAFSPDGQQIAYAAQGGIYVVATAGGEARRLISSFYSGTNLAWSEDGRFIEFINGDNQLIAAAVDGSSAEYGDVAAQPPLALGSAPFRCTVTLRNTGQAPVIGVPGADPPPDGPIYDLFMNFTRDEAVVQLTEGGIYGPLVYYEGKIPAIAVQSIGAWAPGPVRAPTLALSDPPMRGCAVLELQTMLNNRDFDAGPVDGIYGPATEAAVRAFQQANNLTVDGIVGPDTWDALGRWAWDR